ncbi:MAG: DMT family transporter [Burkholderiaceae bacterium]
MVVCCPDPDTAGPGGFHRVHHADLVGGLAVLFLGERMNGRKWFAVLLGLVGVAVIVRPGAGELDVGQLIALASALGFAVSVVLVKSLTRTEAAVAISFWMLVLQSAIGLVPALAVWQWPSAQVWGGWWWWRFAAHTPTTASPGPWRMRTRRWWCRWIFFGCP